jgi:hypothetical protein
MLIQNEKIGNHHKLVNENESGYSGRNSRRHIEGIGKNSTE